MPCGRGRMSPKRSLSRPLKLPCEGKLEPSCSLIPDSRAAVLENIAAMMFRAATGRS